MELLDNHLSRVPHLLISLSEYIHLQTVATIKLYNSIIIQDPEVQRPSGNFYAIHHHFYDARMQICAFSQPRL